MKDSFTAFGTVSGPHASSEARHLGRLIGDALSETQPSSLQIMNGSSYARFKHSGESMEFVSECFLLLTPGRGGSCS